MSLTMRKLGWGIGAAVVVLAGVYALTTTGGDAPRPVPGECASISGTADQPRYQVADCAAAQANVKVAKVVDQAGQCPTGGAPYSTYTGPVTLCLIPNLVEGSCYEQDGEAGVRKADCGSAEAVKVVKADRGGATCGTGRTLTYPEPSVTFCLARVGDLR
ncbi:putative secreted protein [Saccharothrix espanaensis DSM 44229]|uniref:Putative secreted protein n=2 Tax=Saccharothrix espanaensis TaxID=103731 RepID=K0JUB0_SACES|nr:putative secreted protein [Saccharothrix espanaensis DSM 44229]